MKLYHFYNVSYKPHSDWDDAFVVAESVEEARRLITEHYEEDEYFDPKQLLLEPNVYEIGEVCSLTSYLG